MSKVHLPAWVEPMAHQHAENFCSHYFEGKNADESEYQDAYSQAFQQFCYEFYKHSLIPGVDESGDLSEEDAAEIEEFIFAQNPGQVVSRAAFESSHPKDKQGRRIPGAPLKPHFMRDFFMDFFKSSKEAQHDYNEIKDATNRAVERFLETQLPSLNLDHGGASKKSAAFKKKLAAMSSDDKRKFYRQAVLARYVRLFMAAYTVSMLAKVFKTNGKDIETFVNRLMAGTELKDLQRGEVTDRFAISIEKAISETLNKLNLVEVASDVLRAQDWKSIPKAPKRAPVEAIEEFAPEMPAEAETESAAARLRYEEEVSPVAPSADEKKAAGVEAPAASVKSKKRTRPRPRS